MTDSTTVWEHAIDLKQRYAARNDDLDELVNMYLVEWEDEEAIKAKYPNIKLTKSPDARNVLIGPVRLLTATDPLISVPFEKNKAGAQSASSKLEKWARLCYQSISRTRRNPLHYDMSLSALLFGEINVAITKTSDVVAMLERKLEEGASGRTPIPNSLRIALDRMKQREKTTPYMAEVWDARTCYQEQDAYGDLTAFYREVTSTAGSVRDEFGAAADVLGDAGRLDEVTLGLYWDWDRRYVWVDEKLILDEELGLPFIPIVFSACEGSTMFTDPEDARQPFLMTLHKSGLWNRQNLALTALYTNLFAVGVNPKLVFERNNPQRTLDLDWDSIGGVIPIELGEKLYPLMKQAIDPSVIEGLNLAEAKVAESTIYKQVLGEPISANATFSATALLHQAGRLPLIMPQRKIGWALSDVLKMCLLWTKHDGRQANVAIAGDRAELSPADIPDEFEIEVALEASLPQDRLQAAQIATWLTNPQNPVVSKSWILEDVLKISDPESETRRIWSEQAAAVLYQQMLQQFAQMMQPAQSPQPPGGPMLPQEGPGQALEQMPTSPMPIAPGASPEQAGGMLEQGMGAPGGMGMPTPGQVPYAT